MQIQKPSQGRVVHICHSGQRVPAIITHVWSDTCVNVQPQGSKAGSSEITSCAYEAESAKSALMPNEIKIGHHHWCWPPRVG